MSTANSPYWPHVRLENWNRTDTGQRTRGHLSQAVLSISTKRSPPMQIFINVGFEMTSRKMLVVTSNKGGRAESISLHSILDLY